MEIFQLKKKEEVERFSKLSFYAIKGSCFENKQETYQIPRLSRIFPRVSRIFLYLQYRKIRETRRN